MLGLGSEAPRTAGGQERECPLGCVGQLSRDQKKAKGGPEGDTTEKAKAVMGQGYRAGPGLGEAPAA